MKNKYLSLVILLLITFIAPMIGSYTTSIFNLTDIFEDSFIIQTYWNDSIEMEVKEPYEIEKKISFLSLVKKYFSKKIRIQLSKIKNLIRF